MNKKNQPSSLKQSKEVAENSYHPSDYQSTNETEKGLAFVHEQVSDAYVEGTIDGEIDESRNGAELGKASQGITEYNDLDNE